MAYWSTGDSRSAASQRGNVTAETRRQLCTHSSAILLAEGPRTRNRSSEYRFRGIAGNWSRDASLRPNHRQGKRWAAKVLQSEDPKTQDTVKQKGCGLPEALVKVGQDLTCCRSHLPMLDGQARRQTSSSEQEGRGLDSNLRAPKSSWHLSPALPLFQCLCSRCQRPAVLSVRALIAASLLIQGLHRLCAVSALRDAVKSYTIGHLKF